MKAAIKFLISFVLALLVIALFGAALVGLALGIIWIGQHLAWLAKFGFVIIIVGLGLVIAYQIFDFTKTIYNWLFKGE